MSQKPLLSTSNTAARMRRERFSWGSVIRLVLPASVIAAFLLFFFTASIVYETGHRLPWKQPDIVFPDFSHYKFLQTLPNTHFPIHPDDGKRIIAIGDIHGMNQSLSELLVKVSYDPQSDTLIHLGDLVPKSKKISSAPILEFLSSNHILGVRGNNDQQVIEWRSWMDWILSLPRGKKWLEEMDSHWKKHPEWERYVPFHWKLLGKHYKFARKMSKAHYNYLRSLPLVLYSPKAHAYFVHAGLLPADPTRKLGDPKQPLSHWPATGKDDRGLQERALLNEIPQNQDPWVLLNMRSLAKDGTIKDGKKGTPWADLWNDVMGSCSGLLEKTSSTLQCFPSMVIYGHAAARDLDLKRWSFGVDTGCAYGRRLTAVVLDNNSFSPQTRSETFGVSQHDFYVPFGDEGTAHIVSVKCDA
ncbi:Metallo-dependent phosphatase-like protein [Chiua virens]|nr:Metallo-dependent phosphatase-like protein [Chiua virens]